MEILESCGAPSAVVDSASEIKADWLRIARLRQRNAPVAWQIAATPSWSMIDKCAGHRARITARQEAVNRRNVEGVIAEVDQNLTIYELDRSDLNP